MTFIRARSRAAISQAAAWLLLLALLPLTAGAEDAASQLDLSAHRGKVVVVDFWASWCAPCRRSIPWLGAMQRKYADKGLVVIGVNEDKTAAEAETFLRDVPADFRIVLDLEGDLARQYELIAMPSTYVFGRDGELVARHLGFKVAKQGEYEAMLRNVLEGSATVAGSD